MMISDLQFIPSHQPWIGWDRWKRSYDKMPRPQKRNKVPMTSISVSQDLWETLTSKKPRRNTMDEYLTRLVEGYYYLKENYTFVEDAYNKAAKKNDEYLLRISELESELGINLGSKVEPSRGAAVDEIVMKCNSVVGIGPTMKCDDNQSTLDLQEVIEQS
jgi:hypothetical protein